MHSVNVYLPSGCRWMNIWTGEEYECGHEIRTDAPLNQILLFMRMKAGRKEISDIWQIN